MVEACRIPENVLNSLSTRELVEITLNYPLYGDIFAYNSLQDGLKNNIVLCSNGVQELLRRPDNARCLLDALKGHDLLTLESQEYVLTELKIGESIWQQSFLEVLISHESVLANAGVELLREIAAPAVKNTLIKERGITRLYGNQGLESSAYLLGATLKTAGIGAASSPELERFLKEGTTRDVRQLIEELVGNYVKF
jgi:hypothetical protein